MSRSKSLSGLKGNIRFTVVHKTWAAISLLVVGVLVGIALLSPAAFGHSGGLAKDGCHKMKAAGERHWHHAGTKNRGGVCIKEGGVTVRIQEVVKEIVVEVEKPQPARCVQAAWDMRNVIRNWRDYDSWRASVAEIAVDALNAGCWNPGR